MSDPGLFDAAARDRLSAQAPLAARLRPRSFDEVVGQDHLVGPHGTLRVLCDRGRLVSMLLWGPAGSGKTTLARLVAERASNRFVALSATSAGVREAREAIAEASRALGEHAQRTVLFVDEVHRFSTSQQDVLLPAVEEGTVVLVGATTENPYFEVNAPLLSRLSIFRLLALDEAAMLELLERGARAEDVGLDDDARELLVASADGDGRALLGGLEVAAALARARSAEPAASSSTRVTRDDVVQARDSRVLHQGRDEHYDQASAFIKSLRGSDPNAALYWLARMLEAGESPRFLARRLVVLASEDIGMADPSALLIATAAASAVELVGLPEAALNLAQATVHLSLSPKSNRVTQALAAAQRDVREGPHTQVPSHLRGSNYAGAASLGHGDGYRYPHDDPSGVIDQQYLPDELVDAAYWRASSHGEEPERDAWRRRAADAPRQD
ncbi:MAG TPA: replication-associated recombination protein A [Acidimicrobiales bacterium]|nr:replication-associated recombination protein A [Acidimicrobiales bacterium]